ncbi:MAG: ABC transporter ATP-binding protein [Fusobacterium sp.]|uniref:ABC transporter ATP-binding protein n=1 Tax=Fusobacterium sp. TaxID=68766 RepID=UPI0026DD3B8D|nr:ABC transporter ATP-binding protein [Fusobacterium sp.]MDO4690191.1 ABC transporter ATP-binding protein [Fusobacterium sp.]
MIEIKNLSYSFGNSKILKDINLNVKENEIVSIIGSSGVGKTTLFNLIAGILDIQDGEIWIDGSSDYKTKVAYMLQKDLLFEHKTAIENIILPLIISKIEKKYALEEAEKILKVFGLFEYADKYPKQLSGGMRQRIALIRTYMFKRKIFLLDEAFSALDAITKRELHDWYLKLAQEFKLTTILITHDVEEAVLLSNKIYILANRPGEIIKEIRIELDKNKDIEFQRLLYKREIIEIMKI